MNEELLRRTTYINAMTITAMAEIQGMMAENEERKRQGLALAYGEKEFNDVPIKWGLTHNAVLEYLTF